MAIIAKNIMEFLGSYAQVTTPIALIAFALACITLFRIYRISVVGGLISKTKGGARERLVTEMLGRWGVPTDGLNATQKYALIEKLINHKKESMRWVAIFAIMIVILIGFGFMLFPAHTISVKLQHENVYEGRSKLNDRVALIMNSKRFEKKVDDNDVATFTGLRPTRPRSVFTVEAYSSGHKPVILKHNFQVLQFEQNIEVLMTAAKTTLRGVVRNSDQHGLAGLQIMIRQTNEKTTSLDDGHYELYVSRSPGDRVVVDIYRGTNFLYATHISVPVEGEVRDFQIGRKS